VARALSLPTVDASGPDRGRGIAAARSIERRDKRGQGVVEVARQQVIALTRDRLMALAHEPEPDIRR
jgi:hypothetical protein